MRQIDKPATIAGTQQAISLTRRLCFSGFLNSCTLLCLLKQNIGSKEFEFTRKHGKTWKNPEDNWVYLGKLDDRFTIIMNQPLFLDVPGHMQTERWYKNCQTQISQLKGKDCYIRTQKATEEFCCNDCTISHRKLW